MEWKVGSGVEGRKAEWKLGNFLNFSYFPTNIKNTFIYLGLEAMMKKKGKK